MEKEKGNTLINIGIGGALLGLMGMGAKIGIVVSEIMNNVAKFPSEISEARVYGGAVFGGLVAGLLGFFLLKNNK